MILQSNSTQFDQEGESLLDQLNAYLDGHAKISTLLQAQRIRDLEDLVADQGRRLIALVQENERLNARLDQAAREFQKLRDECGKGAS